MIEINDFERAIADYLWVWCDVDALLEDDEVRGIVKREAAEILELAKKELMRDAISVDIDDFGIKMYEYCIEKLGMTSEDKVKVLILKDDESSKD